MDLSEKFTVLSSCKVISIAAMEEDRPYHIKHAAKVSTRYGDTILLTLQDSDTLVKVFLSRSKHRCWNKSINNRTVNLAPKYKGTCAETKSYVLAIENISTIICIFRWIWLHDLKLWRWPPIIQIINLDLNKQYPILWAKRVRTSCGETVMLTLRASETFTPRVVLPLEYRRVVYDEDIIDINQH
jgi:hypothetical protein